MTEPPLLPPRVPPDPNGRFTHFIDHDAKLWRRFLLLHPPKNATVAYDVHVGTPAPVPDHYQRPYRRMIETLSTKRIDAVLFAPNETLVVEVKPYAGTQSIGQALANTALFKAKYPQFPSIKPAIVTDTAQPDMPHLCATFQILLIELDPD